MIQNYIDQNKEYLHPGDILFVGSTSSVNRQEENGFVMIGKDYQTVNSRVKGGSYLPIDHLSTLPSHIRYKKLLDKMLLDTKSEEEDVRYVAEIFWYFEPGFEKEQAEECLTMYQNNHIY